MTAALLLLSAGVLLAWLGGSLFVDGAVGLARRARWPAAVVGVTVAAFGTSSPELLVAIQAAVDGVPQISLGDVLGSNVVNIALILALVLASSGLKVADGGLRRDWWAALAVPALLAALLADGWFGRLDAGVLLAVFAGWLAAVVRRARRHAAAQATDKTPPAEPPGAVLLRVAGGLGLLLAAAQCVVHGGTGVAQALGWSPFVVGAVVVAVATGTPELATTLVARWRGHHDVGLASILGSNIFNGLCIAALAALIRPYPVRPPELVPSLVFGALATLLVRPGPKGRLGRSRGLALLALYAAYLALSLRSRAG